MTLPKYISRQLLILTQTVVLCLTSSLKYDSTVRRMIKLLFVSWVQVFIKFLLASFCADYSNYYVWVPWSDTVHTECSSMLGARYLCDTAVTRRHVGAKWMKERRLNSGEDESSRSSQPSSLAVLFNSCEKYFKAGKIQGCLCVTKERG